MDLRVCVKISNSLDINNNELVSWALEGEVTEGLERTIEDVWEHSPLIYWKQQHIVTCYKWEKNLITLSVKYNQYKYHDESSKRD